MITTPPNLHWQWYAFSELSNEDLYAILALRQLVFVVEQHCPYLDCDGLDRHARHLVGWRDRQEEHHPHAYLRVLPPERDSDPVRIGRLLTHPEIRGQGVGHEMLRRAMAWIASTWPRRRIAISAQQYLQDFYRGYGFHAVSASYLEDGIPHVAMVRES